MISEKCGLIEQFSWTRERGERKKEKSKRAFIGSRVRGDSKCGIKRNEKGVKIGGNFKATKRENETQPSAVPAC